MDFPGLPRVKSRSWSFQSEYRFSLFAMPIPTNDTKLKLPPNIGLGELISDAWINNIDPGISFIDVAIDPEALRKLTVRTGPLCTPGGKICVEALITLFAPEATVEASALEGSVRAKK